MAEALDFDTSDRPHRISQIFAVRKSHDAYFLMEQIIPYLSPKSFQHQMIVIFSIIILPCQTQWV